MREFKLGKKMGVFFWAACLIAGGFVLGAGVVCADTDTEAEAGLRLAVLQGLVRLVQGEADVPSEVVNSLKNSLINDPNPQVRGAAAKALGDLGVKQAIPDLQKRIDGVVDIDNTEERDEQVIGEIIVSIVKLGGEIPASGLAGIGGSTSSEAVGIAIEDWQFEGNGKPIELKGTETLSDLFYKLEWLLAYRGSGEVDTRTRTTDFGYEQRLITGQFKQQALLKEKVDVVYQRTVLPEELKRGDLGMPGYSSGNLFAWVYEYEYAENTVIEHRSKKELGVAFLDRAQPVVTLMEQIVRSADSHETGTKAIFRHRSGADSGQLLWTVATVKGQEKTHLSLSRSYMAMLNLPQGGESALPVNGPIDEFNELAQVGIGSTSPRSAVDIRRGDAVWGFNLNGVLVKREGGFDPLSEEGKTIQDTFGGGELWFTINDANGNPIRVKLQRKPARRADGTIDLKAKGEWGYSHPGGAGWIPLVGGANPRDLPPMGPQLPKQDTGPIEPNPILRNEQSFPPIEINGKRVEPRINWAGPEKGYVIEHNVNYGRGGEVPKWGPLPNGVSLEEVLAKIIEVSLEDQLLAQSSDSQQSSNMEQDHDATVLDEEIEKARERLEALVKEMEKFGISYYGDTLDGRQIIIKKEQDGYKVALRSLNETDTGKLKWLEIHDAKEEELHVILDFLKAVPLAIDWMNDIKFFGGTNRVIKMAISIGGGSAVYLPLFKATYFEHMKEGIVYQMDINGNQTIVRGELRPGDFAKLLAHEIVGHGAYFGDEEDDSEFWKGLYGEAKATDTGFPSNYAQKNHLEFQAEWAMYYVKDTESYYTGVAKDTAVPEANGITRSALHRTAEIFAHKGSDGKDYTYAYKIDNQGNFSAREVPIVRNERGQIIKICFDPLRCP